jgi:2-iminobutanoate/2-iminopropanoate deaminase
MKQAIKTEAAPAAIGPYSQAVRQGDWLLISGQLGMDPASGAMVSGETAAQAEQALKNIGAILEAAGSDWPAVTKMTVYVTDLNDFGAVNEVYGRFLAEPYPARACVEVSALPKGGRVEFDAMAWLG